MDGCACCANTSMYLRRRSFATAFRSFLKLRPGTCGSLLVFRAVSNCCSHNFLSAACKACFQNTISGAIMNSSTKPLFCFSPGACAPSLPARPVGTPQKRHLAARGVDLGGEKTALWAIYRWHVTNWTIFSDMCIYNIL